MMMGRGRGSLSQVLIKRRLSLLPKRTFFYFYINIVLRNAREGEPLHQDFPNANNAAQGPEK